MTLTYLFQFSPNHSNEQICEGRTSAKTAWCIPSYLILAVHPVGKFRIAGVI